MAFDSVSTFLAMGAHGIYVWSAYGLCLLSLGALIFHTLSYRRKVRQILYKRFMRDQTY